MTPNDAGSTNVQSIRKDSHKKQMLDSGIQWLDWIGVNSKSEGLAFRYFNPETKKFDGYERVRLDSPREKQKYVQPKGTEPRLYFPATFAFALDDIQKQTYWASFEDKLERSFPVVVVEGEKKALALQEQLGPKYIVLGIGGCWNWSKKRDDDRVLISDFRLVNGWRNRTCYICFDSDVETNKQVQSAEFHLSNALYSELGVRTRLITLPDTESGHKQGIDDIIQGDGDFVTTWKQLKNSSVPGPARYRLPVPISGGTLCDTQWEFEDTILGDSEGLHLLVDGGTSFVHAGSGVGKTYFVLQLAAAISNGAEFLGWSTKRRDVLFLQQELSSGWFARRVRRLRDTFGEPVNSIRFVSGDFPLASQDRYRTAELHLNRLERLIVRCGVGFAVLDPLQGYFDLSESSTDHAREFMKGVTKVAKKTGCHILMSHHDRKDTSGSGLAVMRGGSPFSDLADTVMHIQRKIIRDDEGMPLKDEFGRHMLHQTDLVLTFDKARHNEGSLPERIVLTRKEDFEDGTKNPFFEEKPSDF